MLKNCLLHSSCLGRHWCAAFNARVKFWYTVSPGCLFACQWRCLLHAPQHLWSSWSSFPEKVTVHTQLCCRPCQSHPHLAFWSYLPSYILLQTCCLQCLCSSCMLNDDWTNVCGGLQSLGIVEKAAKRAQKRARGQKVPA